MRWRTVKRLLRRRPFLVNQKALPYNDAKNIYEEGFADVEEVLEAARLRSDVPAPAWLEVDRIIERRKKRVCRRERLLLPLRWLTRHPVAAICIAAAAVALAALLIVLL